MQYGTNLIGENTRIFDQVTLGFPSRERMDQKEYPGTVIGRNAVLRSGTIATLGDLVRRDISELLKFRNFGRKSLSELTAIVEEYGLTFGMDVDRYLKE